MADYLISEETLTNMANSIRTLSGATGEITPGEMVTSINETKSAIDMINEHEAKENNPHNVTAEQIGAAPMYSYGTTDLIAGTSPLESGKLYFVYE